MTDDLQKTKDDYQAIRAPAHLAARVRASIESEPSHFPWVSRFAAVAVALAVLVPLLLLQQSPTTIKPGTRLPPLSQLAPEKPPVSVTSLGSLRSVSLPPMPRKPEPATKNDSQSRFKDTSEKETHHEHA